MKTLHTADLHFDESNQVLALASFTVFVETAERERPALAEISGDLFNRAVKNTAASGFVIFLGLMKRLLDVCPVASVYGTPSHDSPGSLEVFTALGKFNFVVIQPGKAYLLDGGNLWSAEQLPDQSHGTLLVVGMPEPSREWLLAGNEGASAQETGDAMKTALRGILLGLGAVRAQRPDLPCVMLYHGPVEGASMQNGQVIGAGSITIGREDLALVDADYYALGDIHLAQQIPGLPAYYPGSAYPVSWGELGQCGFNLVEIEHDDERTRIEESERFNAMVTRIPFPNPRRCKFEVDYPEPVGAEVVQGVQAWIRIRATKDQAAKIDTTAILEAYREQGALEGSRVTVELIPTETVRAAEITEKHALRDKVVVYENATIGPHPGIESVLLKADQLERESAERGAAAGLHFRLRRLRLRGAVGIWKGLRQDEIDIDLDTKDPGLIALIGANGAGKSTLIENMHPYSCMLTRDGPLQDHFRLRDSARELWFVDERTGTEYRALMEIDGANVTGSVKYHLFRNGEPVTNGRKADYDEAIEHLIGSLPLFLRSAFVSQRPTKSNPDLSEATKGEKKAIFRELAGLDYMQAYAESAKGKATAIEAENAVERGRISLIESQLAALPGVVADVAVKRADCLAVSERSVAIRTRGEALASEVKALAEKVSEQKSLAEMIAGIKGQSAQKQQVIHLAQESITEYQQAVEWAPEAQKVIAAYDDLKEQENAENRRLSAINADNARLQGEYTTRLKSHHADVQAVEAKRGALKTKSATLAGARNVLQAKIDHLSAELGVPLNENCPTCGQLLPAEKRAELGMKRAEIEQKVKDLTEKHTESSQEIVKIDQQIAAIVLPPALSPFVPAPADQAPLRGILVALAALKIDQARKNVTMAQEAATRLQETEKQKKQAEDSLSELTDLLTSLESQLDATIQTAYDEASRKLEAARAEYGEAQKAIAGLEAEINALDKRIAELQASEKDLGDRKVTMEERQACAAEWRFLEVACGPDGIQALELDAMGPGISEVANRLLSAAYGSRFSIELRTTRIAGKGSRTKQVEDFAIIVLDNELLTEQPIETLSGGESVWIKRALYDSFALIRDRTTGIRFLTVFADEADGALDPESRQKYFAMLEAAHQESGRRHTILITHSPEVQEAIGQRIELKRAAA